MNCSEIHPLISARLDGQIAADQEPALNKHLAGCADCRALADALATQDERLRHGFAPRRQSAQALADRDQGPRAAASPHEDCAGILPQQAEAHRGFSKNAFSRHQPAPAENDLMTCTSWDLLTARLIASLLDVVLFQPFIDQVGPAAGKKQCCKP